MAIRGMAVDLRHDQVFAAWELREATLDADGLVALFGWIEFEFEFVVGNQIVGDGRIVSDQAIRKVQVY
jgi:hypothetical protein